MFENLTEEKVKEMVLGAYNKYKSRLYYTRGFLLYKKEMAKFEYENFDNKINDLTSFLFNYISGAEEVKYLSNLIDQVSYIQGIKKVKEATKTIDVNFFIDMPVELHIIDTIWTVFAAHSNSNTQQKSHHYGNLIDTGNLFVGDEWDSSEFKDIRWDNNCLFKKYIYGYNDWVTNALNIIEKNENIHENMTLLSVDMKRYYYSTYKTLEYFSNKNSTYGLNRLTSILLEIHDKYYNELFKVTEIDIMEGFLPIGMSSSMYLSNIFLDEFDEGIKSNENVLFYGRYVDDIIIIFNKKIEKETLKKIITNELSKSEYYKNIKRNEDKTKEFYISDSHFLTDFEKLINYIRRVERKYYNTMSNEELSFRKYIDFDKRTLKSNLMEKAQISEQKLVHQDIKDILLFMNYIFDQVQFENETIKNVYSKIHEFVSNEFNPTILADIFMWLSKFGRKKEDTLVIYNRIKEKLGTLGEYTINEIKKSEECTNDDINKKLLEINYNIIDCAYLLGTIKNELQMHGLFEKFEKSNLKKKYGLIKYFVQCLQDDNYSFKNGENFYKEYFDGHVPFIHLDEFLIYDQFVNILKSKRRKFNNSIDLFIKINKMGISDFDYISKSKERICKNYDSYVYNIDSYFPYDQKEYNVHVVSQPNINIETNVNDQFSSERKKPTFEETTKFIKILIESVNSKSNILVLPELFVKLEWLPIISYFSRVEQIIVIGGLKAILYKDRFYNLIFGFYPFRDRLFRRNSLVVIRQKNNYSYDEKVMCDSKGLLCNDNKSFYYYVKYKDISLTNYLCFEITDIMARGLFKGEVDVVAIPMLNHDTNYFNNIIESLSRDLSSIIITSNSAKWGNTSIILPKKTNEKILTEFKGGFNNYVVSTKIPLLALVDFNNSFNWKLCKSKEDLKFKKHPANYKRSQKEEVW